jgi:heme A synthase
MLEHRFTKLVAFATFVLLVIGGTVNATGSSLACPEPTFVCNGELFPAMTGGVFYEHGHRLVAETVGILQLILTVLLLRRRPQLRRLAWLLLGMIALQASLGAITVYYLLPWYVSTGHLVLGMGYFATLVYTAFVTRPAPSVVELEQHERRRTELGSARRWIVIAVVAVFVQLLLGALVRHLGAAMVCLGMPTCTISGDWLGEAPVQHLHMLHRVFGVIVGIVTTIAAIQVWRAAKSWSGLRLLALLAPLLVGAQVALGIYTVLTMRSVPVAVGHFAGAVSLWALWISALLVTRSVSTSRPLGAM